MCHIMWYFNTFFKYDSEHDYETTTKHSKHIIELSQNQIVLFDEISTIKENTDGCNEQYHCATALYLLSVLAHI